jgi:hypothetical protein
MNEKVSIFLAGIRPENWTRLYQSVTQSTLREFEIIFVGPKPPADNLLDNANVKFIQDFGCSSRCYHLGLLASSYDFVTWAADDGWFLENRSIDKAFDKLLSMVQVIRMLLALSTLREDGTTKEKVMHFGNLVIIIQVRKKYPMCQMITNY